MRLQQPGLGRRRVRCGVQPFQPGHGIVNFVGLKAHGAELSLQMRWFGAGLAGVIVFVNEHKDFKHAANITHKNGLPDCVPDLPVFSAFMTG
jgi:hypothetical protein